MRASQLDECKVALAAAASLMLTPVNSASLAIAGMTSVRGRSHTFDARADGYARGEACGGVVLRHNDAGEAPSFLGSAVRQDGLSASLTAPNGQAQQELLKVALADAATTAHALTLSEAHGTGTALGDPIETDSFAKAVLALRREAPLAVGSVKANSGHGESAAGVTGLLKLELGLQRNQAAPNTHLRVLNRMLAMHLAKWATHPLRRRFKLACCWPGRRMGASRRSATRAPSCTRWSGVRKAPGEVHLRHRLFTDVLHSHGESWQQGLWQSRRTRFLGALARWDRLVRALFT
jgi:3-oxoacyl-(acyl-carrier-protein) synthase